MSFPELSLHVLRSEDQLSMADDAPKSGGGASIIPSALGPKVFYSPDDVLALIGVHRYQYLIIVLCGFAYASYNIQLLLQSLISTSMWDDWPHLASSSRYNWIFFVTGSCKLIGALLLVPLQDIFGRRLILMSSLLALSLFTAIGAAMPTFWSYCVARCLVYLVSPCVNCSVYVYQIEMVPIRSRALPPTLTQLFGTTGIVFITLVWWAFGSDTKHAWRYITLLSLIPSLLALVLLFYLPFETPRFYCALGNESSAWKVFDGLTPGGSEVLTALLNDVPLSRRGLILNNHVVQESCAVELRSSPAPKRRHVPRRLYHESVSGVKRMKTLLFRSSIAPKMWVVCALWACQAFGYWGVTSYLPSFFTSIGLDPHIATVMTFIFEYPGMLVSYFMMKGTSLRCLRYFTGRVRTLRVYTFGVSAVLAAFAIMITYLPRGHFALYIPTLLTYFFAAPVWTILYTYTPELFPTECRGTAMSIAGLANGFPTLVTFFLGSQAVGTWVYPAIWAAVFGLLFAISLVLVHQETANVPLQDRMESEMSLVVGRTQDAL
eukprot:Blabericola_migrator_1__1905@NODE_1518_length_4363_cov_96_666899_g998_i0_p1_GENE_NODE_1518_length_4363_cov_96_666899_g998_i0NODE_1518_length_4363_cov_96_666899_g998_i0_p1_ORF_typecomplete_len548_score50_31Sugar_tr/PF00083_24/1_8e47MFS_1/PF07690_16/1_2e19MFS_1/PF07690_16/6_1e07TRI12/PF06609_13/7_8e09TRI12/PF06609_13/1_5e03MFS_3/PF05977_13/0_012MFS_3/PF05977_13/0_00031MFS_4/PF06779_14/0_00061MFS_4/PF06779_14/1_1e04MFS_2/PF13347_6/58MFS_2/PF13347_6/2_1MFS_2/PF13347_6/0_022MFS_2/PF13347_6/9_5_NODE_1